MVPSVSATPSSPLPREVSCQELKQKLDAQADLLLIDCREPVEHQYCRIESARLLPMAETPAHLEALRQESNREIIIYCHHGIRSLQVVDYLRLQGIPQARSLSGGIDAWSLEIDGSVPRY